MHVFQAGRRAAASARAGRSSATCRNGTLAESLSGHGSPELKRDEGRGGRGSPFEARWKGTLAAEAGARRGRQARPGALRGNTALERIDRPRQSSCGAGLCRQYRRSSAALRRHPEKMTDSASAVFTLEMNLIDDALIEKALAADPAFGHYRPWVLDLRLTSPLPARGPGGAVSTVSFAWNRLSDETMTDPVDGEELDVGAQLNKLQDADGEVRRKAAEAGQTSKNLCVFTLITNTLAGDYRDLRYGAASIADSPPSGQSCRARRVSWMRFSPPPFASSSAPVAPLFCAMKARWLGMDQTEPLGPQRAKPLPETPGDDRAGNRRRTLLSPSGRFSPRWSDARVFFDRN